MQRARYAFFLRIHLCFLDPEIPFATASGAPVLHVATCCSVSRNKLLERCVQPCYLPIDAGLNLLLQTLQQLLLHSSLDQTASVTESWNFCCIWLCLMFVGFSFLVVARDYSQLSLLCSFLFVCLQSDMVEIPVLLEVLICRSDDYKVISSPDVTEEASKPKE